MTIAVLKIDQIWVCPNCTLEQVTHEIRPHVRMHTCRGFAGLTTPMVPKGTKCKVEVKEREDYVGEDEGHVFLHEGRPIMSVVTTRDDGQDVAVFAPTATARGGM